MKLGKIVLQLRLSETRFNENIAGAADLNNALRGTLMKEAAFVIPLGEVVNANEYDNNINQKIIERFGVVCAIKTDTSQKDKTGLAAYDQLYDTRSDLFKAIVGWDINEAESMIYYKGGSTLGIDSTYIWYQFEFEYTSRLGQVENVDYRCNDILVRDVNEDEVPTSFDRLYTNFILAPDKRLPYTGDLPLPDGFPDVIIPDMAQMINMSEDIGAGDYYKSFASAFKWDET